MATWELLTDEKARLIWDQKLARFDDCSPFQSYAWGEYRRSLGWKPFRWVAVTEEGEITAQIFRRRQRPMARNDAGLRGRHSGQRFRPGDHSAEPAAGGIIDEWIPAIEEQIAGVDYIGFLEMHKDVAIGVRRRHRHEPDFVTIKV